MAVELSNPSKIKAILNLMEDSDEVWQLMRPSLLDQGEDFLSELRRSQRADAPEVVADRLDSLAFHYTHRRTLDKLSLLKEEADGDLNLEDAVFLLSEIQYPDLDRKPSKEFLDQMADEVRAEIKEANGPQEVLSAIQRQVFITHRFRGNSEDYYDPDNSFLHKVIERRTGIPIALSVIYLLLARRINFPLFGVGMPGHFLVSSPKLHWELFIDPFHMGQMIRREDCEAHLRRAGFTHVDDFLRPVNNRQILQRMCRNLAGIYQTLGDKDRLEFLSSFAAPFGGL